MADKELPRFERTFGEIAPPNYPKKRKKIRRNPDLLETASGDIIPPPVIGQVAPERTKHKKRRDRNRLITADGDVISPPVIGPLAPNNKFK